MQAYDTIICGYFLYCIYSFQLVRFYKFIHILVKDDVKKTEYDKLVKKVNTIQTIDTSLVKKLTKIQILV